MTLSIRSLTRWLTGIGLVVATTITGVLAANESCWTSGPAQYFNAIQYCVSSVLAPQAGNTYGPNKLASDTDKAAWCEGVPGPGIGETITIRVENGSRFRRLLIGNGYSKSVQSYARNGRIKTVEITTDTGISAIANLEDRSDLTPVYLTGMARDWIRLKIVDVYPGGKYADTCLSYLGPDFDYEEELLLEEQGLLPR